MGIVSRSQSPFPSAEADIFAVALGVISWNAPTQVPSSTSAVTSQTIHAIGVPYRAGQVVTNIGFVVSTVATGTAPTGAFVGISTATAMLRGSANRAADANWANPSARTFPLSSPITIPADGLYYHLLLVNGAWGTTQPLFSRLAHPNAALLTGQINGAGVFQWATAGTGQTALPADNAAVVLSGAGTIVAFQSFST